MFGEQFYPTPVEVIDKMIAKLDWEQCLNILEPSAGKGDIIKRMNEKDKYGRKKNIYACEIDFNLRKILQQDYVKIIGYDFLNMADNFLQFDTIIMNPPFKDGVDHILKAWKILDKGTIVCLLNEETIKNPYSEKRKMLLKIIEDNKGEIEYLGNCFSDSERETEVGVAMVTLKKETGNIDKIFEGFQKDFLNTYTDLSGEIIENEIVVGTDKVEHLIRVNEIMKRETIKYMIASARLYHYKGIFSNDCHSGYLHILKNHDISFRDLKEKINEAIFELNKASWSTFFSDTNIRSKMTDKVYKEFISEYSSSCIDFSKDNIQIVTDLIVGQQDKIFEQNVVDIFDEFTKYYEENRVYFEGWKTNSAWKVGKKVILPYYLRLDRNKEFLDIDYTYKGKLYDIDKCMALILGIDIKGVRCLEDVLPRGFTPGIWYESTFFKAKGFKKGTLHIEFKDLELLKKFNYIVCKNKNWLPPEK